MEVATQELVMRAADLMAEALGSLIVVAEDEGCLSELGANHGRDILMAWARIKADVQAGEMDVWKS